MKDRAALGMIEAAEAEGRCVRDCLFFPSYAIFPTSACIITIRIFSIYRSPPNNTELT